MTTFSKPSPTHPPTRLGTFTMNECDSASLVMADPFRCRVWPFNDRIEDYVTEASCQDEIRSIATNGQLIPVIGRTLSGDPDFDIEIICGSRRLFIARHLKLPLSVELKSLTDRQAATAVEAENSLRKKTSPYERGLWLSKLLGQGLYRSRDEMARELGIAPAQITRLLKFPELPVTVIAVFSSPHDILESWAVELHKAWNDERRRLLADRSQALVKQNPRPPAASIYQILMAPRELAPRSGTRRRACVVNGPTGQPLVRLEYQRKEVVFRIPNALINANTERALTEAVVAVLTGRAPQQRANAA